MRYYILFLLTFTVASLRAQIAPDQIYKVDKTIIQAVVDEIGDNEIIYFLPKDTAKHTALRIQKKQVWKIVYGNGETELISPPSPVVAETAAAPQPVKEEAVPAEKPQSVAKAGALTKLSVTAGFEGNYLLGAKIWTDEEEGAGLMTLLGGSVRGNYQLGKSFAVFVSLSYSQASVQKNYLAGEETVSREKLTLSGPGAGLGIKYFFKKSLYVVGEGRGNFLKAKTTILEEGEEETDQLSATCPSFAIGVGFTRKVSRVVVEAELRYQMMQSKFASVTDPFHMVGARLGIGIASFGKK